MSGITTACVRIKFCAGHRLWKHKGKCRHLHGHNYVAEVTIAPRSGTNELGFVADFGDIKRIIKGWIDEFWDHAFLYHADDPVYNAVRRAVRRAGRLEAAELDKSYSLPFNPTAENMAKYLHSVCVRQLEEKLEEKVIVLGVKMQETDTCYATYGGAAVNFNEEAQGG
jgi:6-pyruvoyltetrahydropterin/6-carboxytetrahydropterin synthase